MKQTVTERMFKESFDHVNRSYAFSDEGLSALFAYLTELEESLGTELELDPIAICCEYSEMTRWEAFSEYSVDTFDELLDETLAIEVGEDRVIVGG